MNSNTPSACAQQSTTRVLIADDHDATRKSVSRFLQQNARLKIVGQASTGKEAMSEALALQPDLIIMDLTMPELDGLSAAQLIKKASPQTLILMFSAHSGNYLKELAEKLGLDGFVTKGDRNLLSAINSLLEHKKYFPSSADVQADEKSPEDDISAEPPDKIPAPAASRLSTEGMCATGSASAAPPFAKMRTAPRFRITAPAELIEPISGERITAYTAFISPSGCYVRSTNVLPPEVVVHLAIERDGTTFETLAQVASTFHGEGMGLGFLDTEPSQIQLLKRWLSEAGEETQVHHQCDPAIIVPREIERHIAAAGFKPLVGVDSHRAIYTRGACTLLVSKDGDWTCYTQEADHRKPNGGGDNSLSLFDFLERHFPASARSA